jgi:hypothetical protein
MKATRIFNLPTPTLAAVLSVFTYAVLFGLATLGKFPGTGRKMDPAVQLFLFLHTIPEWLVMSSVKALQPFDDIQSNTAQISIWVAQIVLALLQWYLVFFVGLSVWKAKARRTKTN